MAKEKKKWKKKLETSKLIPKKNPSHNGSQELTCHHLRNNRGKSKNTPQEKVHHMQWDNDRHNKITCWECKS